MYLQSEATANSCDIESAHRQDWFKDVPMFDGIEVAPTIKQYQASVNYWINYSTNWRPLVLWLKWALKIKRGKFCVAFLLHK